MAEAAEPKCVRIARTLTARGGQHFTTRKGFAPLINTVCTAKKRRDGVNIEQQHLELARSGARGVGARSDAATRWREREILVAGK